MFVVVLVLPMLVIGLAFALASMHRIERIAENRCNLFHRREAALVAQRKQLQYERELKDRWMKEIAIEPGLLSGMFVRREGEYSQV